MTRLIALLAALTLLALGGATVAPAPGSVGPTLRSTLDGKKVLPHRIRWRAAPNVAVRQVVFFVDGGKARWIAHEAPYAYAEDGYLVTSFLKPGKHRFTVRATGYDGTVSSSSVVARVVAAPGPPADLAGTWERTVAAENAPASGSAGNPTETNTPSGTYSLTFEKRWIRDDFPGEWALPRSLTTGEGDWFLSDYTARADRLRVQGAVVVRPYNERLAGGGAWCYFSGPPAEYAWSVNGGTLTLAPVGGHDACAIRGFIWTGNWTRMG